MLENKYVTKLIANYNLNKIKVTSFSNEDIIKAQNGDSNAFLIILKLNIGMIYTFATKFDNIKSYSFEDLFDYGVITLYECLPKFDVNYGVKFNTYAFTCLKNAYSALYKKNKNFNRFEVLNKDISANDRSFIDNQPECYTLSLKRALFNKEYVNITYNLLKEILNEKQFEIITLRYGLFNQKPHTLRELATIYQCSTTYINCVETQAKKHILKNRRKILNQINNILIDTD